jgi:hypothetical protein
MSLKKFDWNSIMAICYKKGFLQNIDHFEEYKNLFNGSPVWWLLCRFMESQINDTEYLQPENIIYAFGKNNFSVIEISLSCHKYIII